MAGQGNGGFSSRCLEESVQGLLGLLGGLRLGHVGFKKEI